MSGSLLNCFLCCLEIQTCFLVYTVILQTTSWIGLSLFETFSILTCPQNNSVQIICRNLHTLSQLKNSLEKIFIFGLCKDKSSFIWSDTWYSHWLSLQYHHFLENNSVDRICIWFLKILNIPTYFKFNFF